MNLQIKSLVVVVLLSVSSAMHASNLSKDKEDVAKLSVANLLYDIAHQKPNNFKIVSKAKLESWGFKKSDFEEAMYFYWVFEDEKGWFDSWNEALMEFHKEGVEKNFDWNNYNIVSIDVEIGEDDFLGKSLTVAKGAMTLKSNGRRFKFIFKDLLIINNEAFFINGLSLEEE